MECILVVIEDLHGERAIHLAVWVSNARQRLHSLETGLAPGGLGGRESTAQAQVAGEERKETGKQKQEIETERADRNFGWKCGNDLVGNIFCKTTSTGTE